jgi:hypothetical protein
LVDLGTSNHLTNLINQQFFKHKFVNKGNE